MLMVLQGTQLLSPNRRLCPEGFLYLVTFSVGPTKEKGVEVGDREGSMRREHCRVREASANTWKLEKTCCVQEGGFVWAELELRRAQPAGVQLEADSLLS